MNTATQYEVGQKVVVTTTFGRFRIHQQEVATVAKVSDKSVLVYRLHYPRTRVMLTNVRPLRQEEMNKEVGDKIR